MYIYIQNISQRGLLQTRLHDNFYCYFHRFISKLKKRNGGSDVVDVRQSLEWNMQMWRSTYELTVSKMLFVDGDKYLDIIDEIW